MTNDQWLLFALRLSLVLALCTLALMLHAVLRNIPAYRTVGGYKDPAGDALDVIGGDGLEALNVALEPIVAGQEFAEAVPEALVGDALGAVGKLRLGLLDRLGQL